MSRSLVILLVCLQFSISTNAQLCAGSLGDPIVNISFGAGPNPGPPLSAATTSYQYTHEDCPGDGYYTVRNNTTACFNNSWYTLASDHTGNPNGYFMLVNASFQPGAFYLDTVKGLCDRTTYELAAWIINVLKPSSCSGAGIEPDITFKVERTDGTLIQSYNTNNIPTSVTPQWLQYGFYFTTPVGVTDVVLRLINNAPGGCGNDLGLDDITFRACGPQITGTINGAPVSSMQYCEGPARQFVFNTTLTAGFTSPVFQWQRKDPTSAWIDIPSATANSYTSNFPVSYPAGFYQFRVAVAESGNINSPSCRIYSQVFTIKVNAYPVANATNNGPGCLGQAVSLNSGGGAQYQWSGPNGFNATTAVTTITNLQFADAGKYYVTVTSAEGCAKLDSTTVTVNPTPTAVVSFTKDTICLGDQLQLNASGGVSYQWTPSNVSNPISPSPTASPTQATVYSVIVSNAFSCKDTATISIEVLPLPLANAGPDKIIFEGQPVQLSGTTSNGDNYIWSPPLNIDNVNSLTPVVTPLLDREYILTVTSSLGCGIATDKVLVKVYKDIFVPNAFTPNGDGHNDIWNVLGLPALKTFKVTVFNRWGEVVFRISNEAKGWDGFYKGQLAPAGTYIYYIEMGGTKPALKGTLTLIR